MQSMIEFWNEVAAVWNEGIFGVGIDPFLLGLAIVIFFIVLRSLFTRIVLSALRGITSRTKNELDNRLIVVVEEPLRFVFILPLRRVDGVSRKACDAEAST